MSPSALIPSSELPTIVLIPGAWHSSIHFSKITTLLRQLSYPVTCVSLASVGASPPLTATFDPDISAIRSIVEPLVLSSHKSVVIVTHSYGGVPANFALSGLLKQDREKAGHREGGVIAIAMIASMAVLEHERCVDVAEPLEGLEIDSAIEDRPSVTMSMENAIKYFYADCERGEAEEAYKALKPMSLACFAGAAKEGVRVAWRDVRWWGYLVCERDQAISEKLQRWMVGRVREERERADRDEGEKNGERITVEESCASSHSPFLSMPERVVEFLRRAAGEDI
ncbi:MAG: hypothetical protein Q9160_005063 [Pyrenula sp. 1 TL-2023]